MDADRFDTLARSLTGAGSRRDALMATLGAALGAVLGASSVERTGAKKKPCPPCKKRKKGKCKTKLSDGTACSGGTCQGGRCTAPAVPPPTCSDGIKNGNETDVDCGGVCPKCGTGKGCQGAGDCASGFCAQGRCVTGQGTCPPDGDVCAGTFLGSCNNSACQCVRSAQGETRCATIEGVASTCGDCTSDDFCAGAFPGIPGAFCAQGGAGGDCCPGGIDNRCVAPCPS